MIRIKELLHEKRRATELHIRQLQREGRQGVRYTAMIPDIPFLICGLLSDVGWIMHLISGVLFLCRNGFHHAADYLVLLAMAGVLTGVSFLIHLNRIQEKEIATRCQKDLSFGLTAFSGLAGALIAIVRIMTPAGASAELAWIVAGGSLNFAAGLLIYLSFKKGIFYTD